MRVILNLELSKSEDGMGLEFIIVAKRGEEHHGSKSWNVDITGPLTGLFAGEYSRKEGDKVVSSGLIFILIDSR